MKDSKKITPINNKIISPESREDNIRTQIQQILTAITEKESPAEMNNYRRLFRKYTPLARRSYVAAYFLKYGNSLRHEDSKNTLSSTPERGEKNFVRFQKLFLNMGKLHNIGTKEIHDLLLKVNNLQSADIGGVNVFRNYSFVEVRDPFANSVIQTLNDYEVEEGKVLKVNFARRKRKRS